MSAPVRSGRRVFNAPPNWPAPPPGWTPPPGWKPNPAWGPPPEGWQFWVTAEPGAPAPARNAPVVPALTLPWYRQVPALLYAAIGTAVVGVIIADMVHGDAGHVIAFGTWAIAGVLCLLPATANVRSRPRTGARVGMAVCACFAVYAGALAVTSPGPRAGSGKVAGDNGTVAPHCYATANGIGSPFTISELGTSDCTQIAIAADMSLASIGYRATPNTPKGPGSAICEGMVDGNEVAVIATESDPALCYRLGLSPM